jgi:hypothetical protein
MANSENQVELKLNLDISGVQQALYEMIGSFNGTDKEFDSISKKIQNSFRGLQAAVKRYGADSEEAAKANKRFQDSITQMAGYGVDPASISFQKLSNSITGTGSALNRTGNDLKKNNMMWTNLALVVQDLPFGFRGIQNNLPALIGGMAGATGAIYLATSAVIALFTAWDMGVFGAKKSTDEWTEKVKKFNEELKASLDYTDSSTQRLKGLVTIGNDYTQSEATRAKAFKAIKEELSKVNKEEAAKIKNMQDATIAVDLYTEAVKQQNVAEVTGKQLAELQIQNLKDRAILEASTGKGIHPLEWFGLSESDAQAAQNRIHKTVGQIRLLEQVQSQALRSGLNNPYSEFNKPEDDNGAIKTQQKVNEQIIQNQINSKKQELNLIKDDAQKKYDVAKELAGLERDLALEKLKNAGYIPEQITQLQLGIYEEYQNKLVTIDMEMQSQLLDNAKKVSDKKKKDRKKELQEAENFAKQQVDTIKTQSNVEQKLYKNNLQKRAQLLKENMAKAAVLAATAFDPASKQAYLDLFNDLSAQLEGLGGVGQQIADTLNNSVITAFESLGQTIGKGLATGVFDFSALGEVLANALTTIGGALIKFAILEGAAIKALKDPKQWKIALAIGIAAVAAGAALKASLANVGGGVSSGSSMGKNSNVRKFANGGIVSGPTFGLMGEYPGAKSNPEVVAPLDKLKDMIGGGGGTFVLRGQDLLLSVNRAQKASNLKGQNISLA